MLILAIPFSSVGDINSPLITSNTERDSAVQFKWVDDDGGIWTDADDDGVIPYVPPIEQVPLDIQFQIIKDNNTYFGQENQQQAMENITLSGNALFTGTLDKIPEVTFINGKTWNVPIVPTMALNGGEITFTVTAWNTTLTEKLSIGGDNLNGTVVTVSPAEFTFGENVTLTVTVKGATGYPFPNAEIYVCYIGDVDGGIPGDPIESHMLDYINGGGNTNGEYTLILNTSQQTVNQTLAGFASVKARRNLSAYVVRLYRGGTPTYIYGYAKFEMKPGEDNHPPNRPIICGPFCGRVGVPYAYTFKAIDPDGDDLSLWIEWGDGTNTGWIGPYSSDIEINLSHSWAKKGNYTIRCKARDPYGAESEWGELRVTMPYNYHYNWWMGWLDRFPLLQRLLGWFA